MPMDVPAGTVLIGNNAYMFPSPAGAGVTDCFILGHGGTPHAKDYQFTVPAGCTVNFLGEATKAYVMPGGGPVEGFRVMSGSNGGAAPAIDVRNRFAAGAVCRDYILAKAVGTHYKAAPAEGTYIAINATLNGLVGAPHAGMQWLPHYVTIRNRTSIFRDTNIWLSKLIDLIRAANPAIVNFYCAHCRIWVRGDVETRSLKSVGSQGASRVQA